MRDSHSATMANEAVWCFLVRVVLRMCTNVAVSLRTQSSGARCGSRTRCAAKQPVFLVPTRNSRVRGGGRTPLGTQRPVGRIRCHAELLARQPDVSATFGVNPLSTPVILVHRIVCEMGVWRSCSIGLGNAREMFRRSPPVSALAHILFLRCLIYVPRIITPPLCTKTRPSRQLQAPTRRLVLGRAHVLVRSVNHGADCLLGWPPTARQRMVGGCGCTILRARTQAAEVTYCG